MNAPQPAQRSTAAVVVQSLMWLWLIFLSVLAALGYQALSDQADQERLDSRLQRLEAQATGLAETIEAIQQRPAVATDADLKDTRQILEARAAQVEISQWLRSGRRPPGAARGGRADQGAPSRRACHRTRPAARIAHVRRLQDRAAAAAIPRRRRRTARRPAQRVRRAEHRGLHARPTSGAAARGCGRPVAPAGDRGQHRSVPGRQPDPPRGDS